MRLFVTVGNATQPFDRLLQLVDEAARGLPIDGVCQHGPSSVRPAGLDCVEMLSRAAFDGELARANRVICHAGVGTLWCALRQGHLPLVLPRRAADHEVMDDHQLDIVDELARTGRVLPIESAAQLRVALQHPSPRRPPLDGSDDRVLARIADEIERRPRRGDRVPIRLAFRALGLLGGPLRRLRIDR